MEHIRVAFVVEALIAISNCDSDDAVYEVVDRKIESLVPVLNEHVLSVEQIEVLRDDLDSIL